jgi:hypothetical protein
MTDSIVLRFTVKGYPGTGRKIEEDSDLAQVSAPDLIQGAFMGDATIELNDVDFTTRFGWVTLIYWCLSLEDMIRKLKADESYVLRFAESDDFMSYRLHGVAVLVASSYRPGIAVVQYDALAEAVHGLVEEKLRWVGSSYPSAFMNPAMGAALNRVGISRLLWKRQKAAFRADCAILSGA